jgi:hypothetical protein
LNGEVSKPAAALAAVVRVRRVPVPAGRDYGRGPLVPTDPDHEASTVALTFKKHLEVYFQGRAAELAAHDPALLAAQLTAIFDGFTVRAVMRAQPLDGTALKTAAVLLDASTTQ